MRKKGAVEIQFNWIFILIAGAIILILFVSIVRNTIPSTEKGINIKILNSLSAAFTSAKEAEGGVKIIETPKVKMEFTCEKKGKYGFSIGDVSKPFLQKVVFAPGYIKGRKTIAWSLDWSVPFRVTNFLYLTSPNTRYVFKPNNELANDIFGLLPNIEGFRKNIYHYGEDINDEGDDKIKFVYFESNPKPEDAQNLQKYEDTDVRAIQIKESDKKIYFYKKDGSSWGTSYGYSIYIDDNSLIGAIFAEDKEMYECVMEKAFENLNVMAEILEEKSRLLITNPDLTTKCRDLHQNAKNNALIHMKTVNFPLNSINDYILYLKDRNQQLLEYSCATIY